MAKATVICTCKICGSTFEKAVYKHNQREVDEFKEWAKDACTVCPSCYRDRKRIKNAEAATAYSLPEIDAVSERQKDYADQLRNRFVAEYEDTVKLVLKSMEKTKSDQFIQSCKEKGYDVQEEFKKAIKSYTCQKAYICLTESNAGKIIDALKY